MATVLYFRTAISTGIFDELLWLPDTSQAPTLTSARIMAADFGTLTVGADSITAVGANLQALSATIGTGAGTNLFVATVAGPTDGKVFNGASAPEVFLSGPLSADVTISGTITFDVIADETSMNANATILIKVYRVSKLGVFTEILSSALGTEVSTTKGRHSWSASPTSTAFVVGERIAVFVLADDATGVNMGGGQTARFYYDGSNANTADAKITFTETLSFATAPSGSTYYLRSTASDISGFKALSTSIGAATDTLTHTTLTGPITDPGDLWTVTAGGADVEFLSPKFNAFTLSGPVAVFIGRSTVLEVTGGTSPRDCLRCELAICDSEGANPVVWSRSYTHSALGSAPDIAFGHYIHGSSTAVAQNSRLRFRFYSDDVVESAAQISGTDRTIRYDGTSTYATRLVFTQSLVEATPGTALPLVRRDSRIVPLI